MSQVVGDVREAVTRAGLPFWSVDVFPDDAGDRFVIELVAPVTPTPTAIRLLRATCPELRVTYTYRAADTLQLWGTVAHAG